MLRNVLLLSLCLLVPCATVGMAAECVFYKSFDTASEVVAGTVSDDAVVGKAVLLQYKSDGTIEVLTYPTHDCSGGDRLDLDSTQPSGSVSLWVRPVLNGKSAESWTCNYFSLNSKPNQLSGEAGTALGLTGDGSGKATLTAHRYSEKNTVVEGTVKCPRDDGWMHLVGTWNCDGEMRIYVNGEPGSVAHAIRPIVGVPNDVFELHNQGDAVLVDEFHLFSRPLTSAEVKQIYGKEGKGTQWTAFDSQLGEQVEATHMFTENKVRVRVRATCSRAQNCDPGTLQVSSASVAIAPKQGTTSAAMPAPITVPWPAKGEVVVEFDAAGLPDGEYEAICTLNYGSGAQPSTASQLFKINHQPPFWLGCTVGESDQVPEPWSALQVAQDEANTRVTCDAAEPLGAREFVLGKSLFPVGLESRHQRLLAGPIAVFGHVSGVVFEGSSHGLSFESRGHELRFTDMGARRWPWQRRTWQSDLRTRITGASPARVCANAHASWNGLSVSADSTIEFDGLLWVKLDVKNESAGDLTFSDLRIEVPFGEGAATLMTTSFDQYEHAGAVGGVRWNRECGSQYYSDRNALGRPAEVWHHRVSEDAQVWLGDEQCGLQVTVPSTKDWHNTEEGRERQIEVEIATAHPVAPGSSLDWQNLGTGLPRRIERGTATEGPVTLRLNLIDQERTLESGDSLEYEFGLHLTPVRPHHPSGWRSWRFEPPVGYHRDASHLWFNRICTTRWSMGVSCPIPVQNVEADVLRPDQPGDRDLPLLYLQPATVWRGARDYPRFAEEWRTDDDVAPPPAGVVGLECSTCSDTTSASICEWQCTAEAKESDPRWSSFMYTCPGAPSWSDFLVGTFWKQLNPCTKLYCEVPWGGVYFDVADPQFCDNADHGCGYVRDGKTVRQPEQRYREYRDLQRRFYHMLRTWPCERKYLFNHQSGKLNLSQLSFCDGVLDGERLLDYLDAGDGYAYYDADGNGSDILTFDRMRAEFMGHNLGITPIFIPYFTRAADRDSNTGAREHFDRDDGDGPPCEPKEVLHVLGLLILHDIVPYGGSSNKSAYLHWWKVQDDFGWGDDVQFVPYWTSSRYVTLTKGNTRLEYPDDDKVACSLYRRRGSPGRVLLAIMNNTKERLAGSTALTVGVDLGALDCSGATEAVDAWNSASYDYVESDGGGDRIKHICGVHSSVPMQPVDVSDPGHFVKFTVEIEPRSFRLFLIKEPSVVPNG